MRIVKPNNPAASSDTGQDGSADTETTTSDSQNIDVTAAALDAFCRAQSQTYEQFMQTFTYLTPADVRMPSSLTVNDGSDSGAAGGHMAMPTECDFPSILAGIARERAEIMQTLSMEEPIEEVQTEPVATDTKTSCGDDLEEEVLGEGLCTSHLTDVSRSGGTFVKFDNFVDDEGSDADEDKDPDADVDDSDVVSSSSYMASFATGAESHRGRSGSPHRVASDVVRDNDREAQSQPGPKTNKHQKNVCNQQTKTSTSGQAGPFSTGIQFPESELADSSSGGNNLLSSIEESNSNISPEARTDQVATCLIRNQIDRQSLSEQESILDLVASTESDDNTSSDTEPTCSHPACDTVDSCVHISGTVISDNAADARCPSHSTCSQSSDVLSTNDSNPQQTCRSLVCSESELGNEDQVVSADQTLDSQAVSSDSMTEEKVTEVLSPDQHRSSPGGAVVRSDSLLDLVMQEGQSEALVYDPDMDGPNPGEVEADKGAVATTHNHRSLEFSAQFKSVEDMIEEAKVVVTTEASADCDDVTTFSLDEDFDYDNVKLTPKFTPEEMAYLKNFLPSAQQSED